MVLRQSQGEACAHRYAGDEDLLAPLTEVRERALRLPVPVLPAGGGEILPGCAVTRQARGADGEARSSQVLRPRADRPRAAGEAVQHQHAGGPALVSERLGTRLHLVALAAV